MRNDLTCKSRICDIGSMQVQEFLEPTQAGFVLGISSAQVRKLAAEGVLPLAARTSRGVHLFRRADVERLRRAREKAREQE